MKKDKLRSTTTICLQKQISCSCEQYEFIETNVDKTKFIPGRTNCLPVYSFANGWQSKKFYFDKNKLVKVQKGRKKIVTVWEFSDDAVVMTIKVDDIVAKKYYERIYDIESAGFSCCC